MLQSAICGNYFIVDTGFFMGYNSVMTGFSAITEFVYKEVKKMSNKVSKADGEEIMRERKRWAFFGIPWTFTKYILTEKKLIIEKGFFHQTVNEILLYRVTDMTLDRTLGQRIFGLGTLTVFSHDKTNPNLVIKNIKHTKDFKDALSEAVEKDRIRMKMRRNEIISDDLFDDDDDNEYIDQI